MCSILCSCSNTSDNVRVQKSKEIYTDSIIRLPDVDSAKVDKKSDENKALKSFKVKNPINTVYAPTLDFKVEGGSNVIYASTVELAWDKLREAKMLPKSDDSNALINYLNKHSVNNSVSPDDYIAEVGVRDSVIKRVSEQYQSKFGTSFDVYNIPGQYILYSYLKKASAFKLAFSVIEREFKGSKVNYMFSGNAETVKQIVMRYYSPEKRYGFEKGDIIFQILLKNRDEELYIAKIKRKETLKEMASLVLNITDSLKFSRLFYSDRFKKDVSLDFPIYPGHESQFFMPIVDFKSTVSYNEINGVFINGHELETNQQVIDFGLTERGVILKSEFYAVDSAGFAAFDVPEDYIVDNSFLILLKEKGSETPYFVGWIDNADILNKLESK